MADGGELIFSLPNGLQGYMLIDAKGQRIDKGPINVVSDPKRPDKAVVNGLSCMSCHAKGMIEKKDDVRAAVLGNPNGYTADVRESVKALYPPADEFEKLVALDKARFAKAVEATGGTLGETEPIVTLALRFEELLDLPLAAAEAGVSSDEFKRGLGRSSELASIFGALNVGGTVQREVYLANFTLLVRDLKLGTYVGKGGSFPPRPRPQPQPRPNGNLIGKAAGELRDDVGLKSQLVWCPPGTFKMGTSQAETGRQDDENQVDVTLSNGFWMGQTEVTQGLFQRVQGTAPWKSEIYAKEGADYAASFVSLNDAVSFCAKLTSQERTADCGPLARRLVLPAAQGSRVGIRLPGRNQDGLQLREQRRCVGRLRVVRRERLRHRREVRASSRTEEAQRLGFEGHARQRLRVVFGLLRQTASGRHGPAWSVSRLVACLSRGFVRLLPDRHSC